MIDCSLFRHVRSTSPRFVTTFLVLIRDHRAPIQVSSLLASTIAMSHRHENIPVPFARPVGQADALSKIQVTPTNQFEPFTAHHGRQPGITDHRRANEHRADMVHNCIDTTILMSLRQLARDYLGIAVEQSSPPSTVTTQATETDNASKPLNGGPPSVPEHGDDPHAPPITTFDDNSDVSMLEADLASKGSPVVHIDAAAVLESIATFDAKTAAEAGNSKPLASGFNDAFDATFPAATVAEIFDILHEAVGPKKLNEGNMSWSLEKIVSEAWVRSLLFSLKLSASQFTMRLGEGF